MIKTTSSSGEALQDRLREMNAALLVSAAHQHELAEEAKKAVAALRLSEERSRALFDSAPMAIFVCDKHGVIQQYNREASDLWERSPVCGVDRYGGSVKVYDANGTLQPSAENSISEVVRYGRPVTNIEVYLERADKTRFPVLINFAPLKSEKGLATGVIASFIDLSDRKAVEDELTQSEERFRLMAETMPQKIFTANPAGDVLYLNPQWQSYTGLPFSQLRDWGWTQIIHPDDIDENMRLWEHSITTGEPYFMEHRLRQADGNYRWHASRAVPLHDQDGVITSWVGSTTDEDDARATGNAVRARLEEEVNMRTAELLATNEQLQGFTYSVAHDLRQQIRGISSNASILVTDSAEVLNPAALQTLSRLVDNSHRLAKLVDDLLTYARLGKEEPNKVLLDLTSLSAEVAAFLIERGGCLFNAEFDIEPGLEAMGDPLLVKILFENLLDNACKYSSKTETPVIKVGREGDAFFVRDNGVGFDMQYKGKLFMPFERLHADSVFAGTGIGLANVKRIVEKHGGEVSAEGKLGEGATFYFTLPSSASPQPSSLAP
jgi:PAS domain S-box-containing protein